MTLDWLNAPIEDNVAELIARKRRAKTIELLRSQLQGRVAPNAQVRMQLCDLLIQAGRGAEAVPVLLGLADEFAADGFVAKAVALLKRVEKIDPGPHVDSRLTALVRQQRASPAGQATPRSKRAGAHLPELGIEEISETPWDAPPVEEAPVEPASPVVTPAKEVADAGARAGEAVEMLPAGEPVAEITPADVLPVDAAAPVEEAPVSPSLPPRPPEPPGGVAQRIRGVFRRFLAALPGTDLVPPDQTAVTTPADTEEAAAEPVEAPVSESREPLGTERPGIEPLPPKADEPPEPMEVLDVDSMPSVEPAAPMAAEPMAEDDALALPAEPVVEDDEPMSDAAFEERLLDLVQEVLHRAPQVPRARQAASTLDRGRIVEYASRLLGMPLFGALAEEELLAVMRGLQLHLVQPGDIVITEGEPGQSLYVLVSGAVKVFVRNQAGRNYEVAVLQVGEFFGEISSLSGRPRTATVIAACACELLELDRATLDTIAATHRRVCDVLEDAYITRASSPESAAVRAVPPTDIESHQRAIEVLEAHFGENRWDPRMRLRLADLLLKAGKDQDAVPILIGLADDLAREGFPERAIAVLKKIERVQRKNIEYVSLAPLMREDAPAPVVPAEKAAAPPTKSAARKPQRTEEFFQGWLVDVVRDTMGHRLAGTRDRSVSAASLRGYGPGLLISPLFEDFDEDELLAFIQGLRLLTFDAGDVVVTEGEPGESVFIVARGSVTVFVRSGEAHNVRLCSLGEGSFFGEMSTLSGEPRNATVTAAAHCELLELDRAALGEIAAEHPRVLKVLEEFSRARAKDPQAAAIRHHPTPTP